MNKDFNHKQNMEIESKIGSVSGKSKFSDIKPVSIAPSMKSKLEQIQEIANDDEG
jgi:hypothetical protein